MSGPLAIFKCAFGGADGWGHVTRCGALASVFRNRGWRSLLWTESDPASLTRETSESFDTVSRGPEIPAATQEAAVLVIDEMYTPDEAFAALRAAWPGRAPFVGIDDMQRRSMEAFDLTVNTEIGLRQASYASSRCLLGERYALLREGFADPAPTKVFAEWQGRLPVFAMVGGTDAFGYTARVVRALADAGQERFVPIVAMGAESADRKLVSESLIRFSEWRLLDRLDSRAVAGWLHCCAFGIIGCGTSLYEVGCMRLPFIGLSLVDNQTASARKAESLWAMPVVYRESRHAEPFDLGEAIVAVLARRDALAGAAYAEIDARGAERVFEEIARLAR